MNFFYILGGIILIAILVKVLDVNNLKEENTTELDQSAAISDDIINDAPIIPSEDIVDYVVKEKPKKKTAKPRKNAKVSRDS